ncbi:MAG: inner membrane CreD family protein [Candidatus Brocadiia bacterium]
MVGRIISIVFIYICTSIAWVILGGTVNWRSTQQDKELKEAVGQLWGTTQRQEAPEVYYQTSKEVKVKTIEGGQTAYETKTETTNHYLTLAGSNIDADIKLEYRQKGLLWYSTYRVKFTAKYQVANPTDEAREVFFEFRFPVQKAVYDNFRFAVAGKEINNINVSGGLVRRTLKLNPNQAEEVEVSYQSQGLDEWWYGFGEDVNQIKNFSLTMHTDFNQIDFPENSISPTEKQKSNNGWTMLWKYNNLLSGIQIGMVMPKKLNPGPWVSQVTYAAPVSLFLFFFLLFILTTVKNIRIHPMNFFFIGAAFFSFHLLLAYLVDHVSIHVSFLICSAVSIFLVVSYMKLVTGSKFAFLETGISQFVYLVLFSYTFFFKGHTGLAITILCIITLFLVMQFTGRLDWDKVFARPKKTGE